MGLASDPHLLGFNIGIEAFKFWYYSLLTSKILGLYNLYMYLTDARSDLTRKDGTDMHSKAHGITIPDVRSSSNTSSTTPELRPPSPPPVQNINRPYPSQTQYHPHSQSHSQTHAQPQHHHTHSLLRALLIDFLDLLNPAHILSWPHWLVFLSPITNIQFDEGFVGFSMVVSSGLSLWEMGIGRGTETETEMERER